MRRALTDEVERLRAATASLGRDKAERDVELGEALTKVGGHRSGCVGATGLDLRRGGVQGQERCGHGQAEGQVQSWGTYAARQFLLWLSPPPPSSYPLLRQVAALEDKVAAQQGLAAEQSQRIKDMEVGLGTEGARVQGGTRVEPRAAAATHCPFSPLRPAPAPPTLNHPAAQASLRQVEARAEELKAAAQGHEARAAEAAAELGKAHTALERMGVREGPGPGRRCGGCRSPVRPAR